MFLKIFEKILLAFWQIDVRNVEVLGLTLIHNAVINIACSMRSSMTQLLLHTFANLTGTSFRVKAKLLLNNYFLGLV